MASNSFEDIFTRLFIHNLNSSVYTAMPATIVNTSTFATEQTVDVKPLINKIYDDGVVLSFPNILAVPVVFPSSGGGLLSFPVENGDTVLIVFSMRSLDDWLEGNGSIATPTDVRTHHINDAVAIPGLYTKRSHLKPNPTDIQLKLIKGGEQLSSVNLKPNGDMTIDTQKDVTITATGNINLVSSSDINIGADGAVNITGATINLN